jgi:hypothetical protein
VDTTPVTPGVLVGLDQFLALNPRPETEAEIASLKKAYAARAAHEARVRSAREELAAAETALLAHGYPREPSAVVDEAILLDMDVVLENMKAARVKFREARAG